MLQAAVVRHCLGQCIVFGVSGEIDMSPNDAPLTFAMASEQPTLAHAGQQSGPSSASADVRVQLTYDAQKCSTGLAYVLWFFAGYLGVHRFYLKRVGSGVAFLLLTIFCFLVTVFTLGFGMILFILPFMWWVIDAFLIVRIAEARNRALAQELTA
jgi:TM2 domain-containing membrane protein YozV